ncbi:MAG: sulfite exporter TauE/SafE family protein [Polymorphobacter sp.]
MIADPLFYLVAIPAVIIFGLAKGGFSGVGVLGVPLMALVISPVQAASIVLPILIVQDVVSVWAFRRNWDGRTLAFMIPGAAVGILLGYLFAALISIAMVEMAVGVTSIGFAAWQLWIRRHALPPAPGPITWVASIFGLASGFTSQISHAGGPPFQMYLLPKQLPRDVFIGTSAIYFAVINWLKVPAYAALGQLGPENLWTAAVLLPIAIASTWAGVILIRRVAVDRFYTLIYGLLLLVGARLVYAGLAS